MLTPGITIEFRVNRGIPIQRALDNNCLTPLDPTRVPSTDSLLNDYRSNGGRINENMSDLLQLQLC